MTAPEQAAREAIARVLDLVIELAHAEDAVAEDVGTGARTPLVILRELVQAEEKARALLPSALPLVGVEQAALPPLRAREEIARLLFSVWRKHTDERRKTKAGPRTFEEVLKLPLETAYIFDCADAILSRTAAQGEWRDISTIPEEFKDGREVLLWWPEQKLDDDGNLTDEVVGGTRVIGNYMGSWQELGGLEGRGAWFGDDSEPGHKPTMWMPLPAPPVAEPIVAEKRPEVKS